MRTSSPARIRLLTAALTAVACVAGLSSAGFAPSATAAPTSGRSHPSGHPAKAPDPVLARQPGPVPALSDENSSTVLNADGSYTTEVSSGPVNHQDESGKWVPISNDLVEAPGTAYAVENEANSYTVSIPENLAVTPVLFEIDDAWLKMKILGGDDVDPRVSGNKATFEDPVPAADELAYEALDNGVKETITLDKAPSSPVSYSYSLQVSDGITPVLTPTGTVEFREASGAARFVIPPGSMSDSARKSAASTSVSYALRADGSAWRFTVTPSFAWLSDPARTYPVVVDPTVDKITQKDCWLEQENPNANHCGEYVVKVGNNNNLQKRRGLFDFNLNNLPPGAVLNNATAWMWVDMYNSGGSGTGTSYALFNPSQYWSGGATWANAVGGAAQNGWVVPWVGGGNAGQISSSSVLKGDTSGWAAFDMTGRVQGWINGTMENKGVLLRQVNENTKRVLGVISSTYPTAGFRPLLRVSWTDRAPTVGSPSVSPTTANSSTTISAPTLSAVTSDPDGGTDVASCFWVYDVSWGHQLWSGCGPWVHNNHASSVAVPAGVLVPGQQYQLQAYGSDGVNWSSNWTYMTFTVDPSSPPLIASGRAVDISTGAPIVGATVAAGVEQRVGPQGGHAARSLENKISTDVTDANGRFALYGNLSAPATMSEDGSVRLEISVVGSNRARIHYVNAVPPTGPGNWKWAEDAAEPAATGAYQYGETGTGADRVGTDIDDLLIDFSSPTSTNASSGEPVDGAAQYPAGRNEEAVAWKAGTMPILNPGDSAEEYADASADWTAVQNGTMAKEEADVAAAIRDCGSAQLPYWEDTDHTANKEMPINSAYLLDKSLVKYTWSTTKKTTATIGITGAAKNYSAGLGYSIEQDSSTGISGTKTKANTNYQWVAKWQYRKQKQFCFNEGYTYVTGLYRWVPEQWRGDVVAKEGTVTRWACDSQYKIALTENYWVSHSTRQSWSGWFDIAGIVGVSAQRASEDQTRTDYLYRTEGVPYRLCGKGALPKDSSYVEEVSAS